MEGLYLYCIRKKTGSQPFSIKGIDEKSDVFIFSFQKIEAIVSRVTLEEFGSEAIQIKAKEDLSWIKERAVIHTKVIEEAMRENDKILNLIPMRFGIIFKEKINLGRMLSKNYLKIKETLDRIQGKQEWNIKVYRKDRGRFEQLVREKNEAIKEKEREIAVLPEGVAFFMEEELKELISKEVNKELENTMMALFENFKEYAQGSVKNKILERELTGKSEPMVLNAAFLIYEERVEDFKVGAERLDQEMQAKGFYLEYSGPWPAYNFSYF